MGASKNKKKDPWRLSVLRLRAILPLEHPVRIIRRSTSNAFGYCDLRGNPGREIFVICVEPLADIYGSLLILAHEWAHARAWSLEPHDDTHDGHWGIENAKAYRVVASAFMDSQD